LVAFECDPCDFSKIRPVEKLSVKNKNDLLLMTAVRQVNLDSFWSMAMSTVDGTQQLGGHGLSLLRVVIANQEEYSWRVVAATT
jgi:hypothetical protein